jgi:tight adherence protein C
VVSGAGTGALLGLTAAAGLVYAGMRSPLLRRVRMEDRVGPYLRDMPRSRLLGGRGGVAREGLGAFARPLLSELALRADRLLGGSAALTRRLQRAGGTLSLEEYRIQQVLWAAAGAMCGLVPLVARTVTGGGPAPMVGAGLAVAGVAGGLVARDAVLSRAVAQRSESMLAEFPALTELLALAVTAGESPVGALERVSQLSGGELSRELSWTVGDIRAGAGLTEALQRMAARTELAVLARFVDGMVVAIERGTPLADVLRAQAADVREGRKRYLLESGGRKEIAMMFPVVFLVLPVTIVFALYPAFIGFTLIAG